MNKILTKEIIKQIFFRLGIEKNTRIINPGFFNGLEPQFIIEKKLAFQDEDGNKSDKNIWAICSEINQSKVKILVADTSDENLEYCVIIQMDNLQPYTIRLCYDDSDYGVICFCIDDNKWREADIFLQSKILSGIEQLSLIYIEWKKLTNYDDLYKYLIAFLNYSEQIDER